MSEEQPIERGELEEARGDVHDVVLDLDILPLELRIRVLGEVIEQMEHGW